MYVARTAACDHFDWGVYESFAAVFPGAFIGLLSGLRIVELQFRIAVAPDLSWY
jgi:hypothetical protein